MVRIYCHGQGGNVKFKRLPGWVKGGVVFCGKVKKEWCHYTLDNEPYPDLYFDFPVR